MSSNQEEVVLSTASIYDGRVVKLRVDTVKLPSGRESKREVIDHKGAVAIVPLMPDSETLLLVRQWRHPVGKALLEIPAGGLEIGELPEECARRELTEEVQKTAGTLTPLGTFYLAPGYSNELMHCFLATDLSDKAGVPDLDEGIEIVEMKIDDALNAIGRGEFEDSKTIIGILRSAQILNR